jgi:hypothetical protein
MPMRKQEVEKKLELKIYFMSVRIIFNHFEFMDIKASKQEKRKKREMKQVDKN